VILLDTDHVNALKYPGRPAFETLTTRLEVSDDQDVATTVITIEEQMRGGVFTCWGRAGAGTMPRKFH